MSILADDLGVVAAQNVLFTETLLCLELNDGRTISVPLAWFPRLLHGSAAERQNWRLIGEGEGIHWPDLDEDISVRGLVLGKRSGESHKSFQRWSEQRTKSKKH